MTFLRTLFSEPAMATLFGAVLGFLAKQFIDYLKQVRLLNEAAHLKERLEYLKYQLSEFYWPLYAGLIKDESIWKLRAQSKDLDEETQRKIQQTIEQELLLPNHQAMAEVISKKLHLSGYSTVPDMYKQYLSHIAAFQALRAAGRLEAPSQIGAPWPEAFEQSIKERTSELTKQYATLLELVLHNERRP